jgi:hypothetical protein
MGASAQVFQLANPHALATIVDASATRKIVASQDIFDAHGTKLWARDQPISHSLHQRLLERKLKQPLETCLRAEDGITPFELHEALVGFLASDHPLAQAAAPWAERLIEEVRHLPMHAAVQLLLTAAHATKPAVFDHAVRSMAVAGAIQASIRLDRFELRLAMLGGLLHDIGEMYVNPQYLDGSQALDVASYRHVVTHPRIGELLLATMTDYPPALARAVGEHHERLDGTGYPMRRQGESLSPLGRVLCATETAMGVSAARPAALSRISFALRMVIGEHDAPGVSFFASAAARAREDLMPAAVDAHGDLVVQLALMDTELSMLLEESQSLAEQSGETAIVRDVASRVADRVRRLRTGWNSIGLWCLSQAEGSPQSIFELSRARDELRYRLRTMERDCLWPHAELEGEDAARLEALWAGVSA